MANIKKFSVKNGSERKVVKNLGLNPQDLKTCYYCSSGSPEQSWRNFQKNVKHRYPIIKCVQNQIKVLEDVFELKPQVVASLEDSVRGFGPKMQLAMYNTIHCYICYGDLVTTGVNHVDQLIKDMLCKIYNNK